jgi:hypothetical protein
MRRNIQKEVVVVAVDNKKKRKVSHQITMICDNIPHYFYYYLIKVDCFGMFCHVVMICC